MIATGRQWRVFDEREALLDVDEHPVRKAAVTGKAVRNKLVGVRSPAGEALRWMLVSAEPITRPDGRMDAADMYLPRHHRAQAGRKRHCGRASLANERAPLSWQRS